MEQVEGHYMNRIASETVQRILAAGLPSAFGQPLQGHLGGPGRLDTLSPINLHIPAIHLNLRGLA